MSKQCLGFAGRYQFVKRQIVGRNEDGSPQLGTPEVVVPWFGNLITDAGLDLLGSSNADNLAYCRLGAGTTTPLEADTALETQAGYSNTAGVADVYGVSGDGSYLYRRVTRRFAAGSVDGVTLTEVGMAATSNGTIFSHALIKDVSGTPVPIVLTPEEVLDVEYELRGYLPPADIVTAATIDGVATTVTMRTHRPSGYNILGSFLGMQICGTPQGDQNAYGCLGVAADQPAANAFGGTNSDTPYTRSYTTGSREVRMTFAVGLTAGNYASGIGMAGIRWAQSAYRQGSSFIPIMTWGFNPKLNKTSSRIAQITVGLSWGRYTPPEG